MKQEDQIHLTQLLTEFSNAVYSMVESKHQDGATEKFNRIYAARKAVEDFVAKLVDGR